MNPYLVLLAIRTALSNHAPLISWANAAFSRPPNILIGNRDIDLVDMAEFPIILLVVQPGPYYGPEYNISLGFGVVVEDYEEALLRLSEFEPLIAAGLAAAPDFSADIHTLKTDGEYYHPKHTMTLDMAVRDIEIDTSTMPTGVWLGRAPDIGTGHEPDYVDVTTL